MKKKNQKFLLVFAAHSTFPFFVEKKSEEVVISVFCNLCLIPWATLVFLISPVIFTWVNISRWSKLGPDQKIQQNDRGVVYFDLLLGAARTQKLVETFFSAVF